MVSLNLNAYLSIDLVCFIARPGIALGVFFFLLLFFVVLSFDFNYFVAIFVNKAIETPKWFNYFSVIRIYCNCILSLVKKNTWSQLSLFKNSKNV